MDIFHHMPDGACCECGHKINAGGGEHVERPSPGDYALCLRCAAVNIYAADLTVRPPTEADKQAADCDPDVQCIRSIILATNKAMKAIPDDTTH